jgi:retinol dehydrogenase-12
MWFIDLLMYDATFGAYTELYSGLSQDLSLEKDQGIFVVPWGRNYPVRSDIEGERGEGKNSAKLFEWCDRETSQYA